MHARHITSNNVVLALLFAKAVCSIATTARGTSIWRKETNKFWGKSKSRGCLAFTALVPNLALAVVVSLVYLKYAHKERINRDLDNFGEFSLLLVIPLLLVVDILASLAQIILVGCPKREDFEEAKADDEEAPAQRAPPGNSELAASQMTPVELGQIQMRLSSPQSPLPSAPPLVPDIRFESPQHPYSGHGQGPYPVASAIPVPASENRHQIDVPMALPVVDV
jgi:hypothetical protein